MMETAQRSGRLGSRDPGLLAWLRLLRVYTEVDHRTSTLVKEYDLTVAQFDVIAQVGSHEGTTQQGLADSLMVTKGNVTQLLDRLEDRGLIERRQVPGRRGKCLFLTPSGWELNRLVVPKQEAMVAAAFSCISVEDRVRLNTILGQLDRGLTANEASESHTEIDD
ncbi:MarR family transcriptional regulator [soil metagenome]